MDTLQDKVRAKLKLLVFRRVYSVTHFQLSKIQYHTKPDECHQVADGDSLTDREWLRNAECHYRNYYGWSSKTSLRSNDSSPDRYIFYEKKDFGTFDPIHFQIDPAATPQSAVPPREGDLLCGIVKPDATGKLCYSKWFICSEQFYRAWTLMMYDTHTSFTKAEQKGCGEKTYWMSGNRLMTNNYLKWILGSKELGITPSDAEQNDRYWHQRCEKIARTWIHIYCAQVLIIRYNESPSDDNVPVVRGVESRPYAHWHLPPEFVQLFLDAYNS